MKIWDKIMQTFNENVRNKYQGTSGNEEALVGKIGEGQSVTINNPTSQRTFTKGEQGRQPNGRFDKKHFVEGYNVPAGNIDIGDTTKDYAKKDHAVTAERTSSAIKSAKYDPNTNTATIKFQGGKKEYQYEVTPEEFNEFINAPSKGQLVSKVWNHNPDFRKPGF